MCIKLVIYKDCNKMNGQQNIKFIVFLRVTLKSEFDLK